MKSLLSFICLWTAFLSVFANDNPEIRVASEVNAVTVFLSGAEVSRFGAATLKPGRTDLIFTGLSSKIDENSIYASTTNGVRILSITHEINYLSKQKNTERTLVLQDSIVLLEREIQDLVDEENAYNEEKSLLLKNNSIGGSDNGVSMEQLKIAADYYRKRIMEVNKLQTVVKRKLKTHRASLAGIRAQLQEFNANKNVPTHEIIITLQCDQQTNTRVDLKYLVYGAGWSPKYDIRAESVNDPIQLEFHALVVNRSDVDWDKVDLTLSTSNPTMSAESPRLTTWALGYSGAQEVSNVGRLNYYSVDGDGLTNSRSGEEFGVEGIEFTEIEISELSVDYEISEKYSIPSDGKPYLVDIKDATLPAQYKYLAVPKLDKDAFLLAKIINWERLNLVEGPANVYFSGTYIGKSFIYTRYSNDTLELSLGRDKKVLVSRIKREEFSSKKFLGTNVKEEFAFRINVKNTNATPVHIRIDDQIPVSQNSEIEVKVLDLGTARLDEITGLLTWELTLEPGQSRAIDFSYWVKYPKNKPVMLKQQRKMYAPKF